ncbi:MAG: DNA polymerase I [Candidatus Firestonebacteria bacterium]
MNTTKLKLFLIDGNSYAYKAFYAVPHFKTSAGQPTNAIFGFARTLLKIIKDYKPDYLGVAFDRPEPTFRHKQYADYKKHRPKMPEELISQFPFLKEVTEGFDIPIFEMPGYEADDVVATLAKKAENLGLAVTIVSGDKDILQIVNSNTNVLSAHKEGFFYDEEKVKERFGVSPSSVPDILALMGDAADNIPGVAGIGEKTAMALIAQFGTIENLYENLDKVTKEKLVKTLTENKESAIISKKLALLVTDVPIEFDIEKAKLKDIDMQKILPVFKKLEFRKLIGELETIISALSISLPASVIPASNRSGILPDKSGSQTIIQELDVAVAVRKKLNNAPEINIALLDEDEGISPGRGKIGVIPVSNRSGILPDKSGIQEMFIFPHEFIPELKPIFENENIKKTGYDIKKLKLFLSRRGGFTRPSPVNPINLSGPLFDIMIAAHLLDYNIKQYLSSSPEVFHQEIFKLKNELEKALQEKDLTKLFNEVEMPLVDVLYNMEVNGIKIDTEVLKELSEFLEHNIIELNKEIYALAGEEFNVNSPKELSRILFEKLNLPKGKKIKTGHSTAVDVLEKLALNNELPAKILDYRGIMKLKSNYVDVLPKLMDKNTFKVHTSYRQTGTSTGRLSSAEPNLQTIPIKTQMGREVRKAFIPSEKNWIFISADYSQIELRFLAHISEDENLINAFKKDGDIHLRTAMEIFNLSADKVTSDMRRSAKIVNFGIIYGMSAYGLSKELNLSVGEAQNYIDNYFAKYSAVKTYISNTMEKVRKDGYVTTILGRRRYFPEINSYMKSIREFNERAAMNMPIQGSASDLIKLAMIKLDKEIKNFKARMLLQVHDELLFEVYAPESEKFKIVIKDIMETAMFLKVPIKVDIKSGKNWYDCK